MFIIYSKWDIYLHKLNKVDLVDKLNKENLKKKKVFRSINVNLNFN